MRPLHPLVLLTLLVGAVSPAHAGEGIVLEAYTGPRPADASRVLQPVLEELARRGFATGGNGIDRTFEAQVSRAPATAQGLPRDFDDQIERGHRAWISGKFDDAVAVLVPLVEAARTNAGTFARDPALRDRMLTALIALALSHHRLGDPDAARETFAQILRSYPDAQVARGSYGPEANRLFEQVKQQLASSARGRLRVQLTNEAAEVFINGRLERRGPAGTDLLPGEYHVLAQHGGVQSRSHRVIVKPGEDATLTIDLAFDGALRSTPRWTGFEFATAEARERLEAGYASAFASAIDGRAVVVVGIADVRGRPAIVGSRVDLMTRRETRRASLALDPAPSAARKASLARFLAGEDASPDIDVQLDGTPGGGPRPATTDPRWGGWTWLAGGTAVAALGTGIVLLAYDGRCSDPPPSMVVCADVYATATPGWVTVGGGAVLAGVTAYLIATDRRAAPVRTGYVVPTTGGAIAGLAARF